MCGEPVAKRYNIQLSEDEINLIKNCRTDLTWRSLPFIHQLKVALMTKCEEWASAKEDK